MKHSFFVIALAALLFSPLARADKPEVKPYAAGAPYGGIPLWEPGDEFIGISSGACAGSCPVYELYLFSDGRVVFSGRKDTRKLGVWRKQVDASVYTELLTMYVQTKVLDGDLKRKNCLRGRSVLTVMRSNSPAGDVRRVLLNSGCEGFADLVRQIEGRFIDSTNISAWLVP